MTTNQTKKYKIVTDKQRELFIFLVSTKNMLIREAAFICDIGYENAKVINRDYKQNKVPKKTIKKTHKNPQ